ncbi:MAG: DUF2306 domain-containing protein [Pseudomonadota bacterium]
MKIITDHKVLPKPALLSIATLGWAFMLFMAFVVLEDSIERAGFGFVALSGNIPAEINPFIDRYTANPWQTIGHCVAGAIFAVLGPLQFASPLRRKFPIAHRISGRIFLPVAIVSGVFGLTMSVSFPMFGFSYNQIIGVAASAFMIFAFVHAYRLVRQRRFAEHREWMMRGFATGMGVALFRVLLEYVLQPAGMSFVDAWNVVTAVSFPMTLGAAEIWIRLTRPNRSVDKTVPAGVQPQA